jgi:cysteine-rich repeat protein
MRIERTSVAQILLALATTAIVSCDGQTPAVDEAVITLAITGTPADVSCLRATVTGSSRNAVKSITATTGQAIAAKLSGLPTGPVTVLLEGFSEACAAVGVASEPKWLSDLLSLTLVRGVPVPLKVSMRENGRINLEVDFVYDNAPDAAVDAIVVVTPPATFTLDVRKSGTGNGTVVSLPGGLRCGPICSASFVAGTVVTLQAEPMASNYLMAWSGAGCSGRGSCEVTMDSDKSVDALIDRVGICGDGIVTTWSGEQCDDQNTDNSDSCSNSCLMNLP